MCEEHRECRRTYWCTVDEVQVRGGLNAPCSCGSAVHSFAQVCAECLIFGSHKGHTATAIEAQQEEVKVEEAVVVPLQQLTLAPDLHLASDEEVSDDEDVGGVVEGRGALLRGKVLPWAVQGEGVELWPLPNSSALLTPHSGAAL